MAEPPLQFFLGPHSLARALAHAALAGGWGGTVTATVPPGRYAAPAAAFWDRGAGFRQAHHVPHFCCANFIHMLS